MIGKRIKDIEIIKVLSKRKNTFNSWYSYEVELNIIYEEIKDYFFFKWRKYHTERGVVDWLPSLFINGGYISDKIYNKLKKQLKVLSSNMIAEGECCSTPNIIRGERVYNNDIIDKFLGDNKVYEKIRSEYGSYSLIYKDKIISFKIKDFPEIYQEACISCNTCVTKTDMIINEFIDKIEKEYNKIITQERVKEICSGSD